MILNNVDSGLLVGSFVATALWSYTVGAFREYAKENGTHDQKDKVKTLEEENEKLRNILHGITHHGAVQPKTRAVTRGLTVVKG